MVAKSYLCLSFMCFLCAVWCSSSGLTSGLIESVELLKLTIINCTFHENSADFGSGGAIALERALVEISNSTFT